MAIILRKIKRLKDLVAVKQLVESTFWFDEDPAVTERQRLSMVYDAADYIEIANMNFGKGKKT